MIKRAIPLLYHDVIDGSDMDASGFAGTDAAEYKLTREEFGSHLQAIGDALRTPVVTADDLDGIETGSPPVLLTFDDGGSSAWEHVAPMLEERGWRGCFFVTTDYIDQPAFLKREQIRDLRNRGHVIGSHSSSHPPRMSDCNMEQLLEEWRDSLQVLEGILDEPVTVASIPGGFYHRKIVQVAHDCGIRMMFTSEPVQRIGQESGCTVIGRFSVKRGDSPGLPAEFVQGNRVRRFRHYAYWNIKKAAKAVTGPIYPWIRSTYLARK